MALPLRILLLVGAFWMVWYICHSIRKAKIQMKDTVAWILIALLLVVFAVCPQLAMWVAYRLGIESTANMVFLIFVAILLYRNFVLSMRVSMLEDKNVTLAAELAIRTRGDEEDGQDGRDDTK